VRTEPGSPEDRERIKELEARLDETYRELRAQAEEVGRLRGIEAVLPTLETDLEQLRADNERLRAELDALRAQLAETQASVDKRVAEEVEAAVAAVRAEFDATARAWEEERARLQKELESAQAEEPRIATPVKTTALADQFRSVLEELAEPPEQGGPAGAALVGIEVDARAYLAPPAEGETLPQLVMVDPAAPVQPEALSTVRLRFGLLPRLPSEGQPPPA
jgi:chromosome segregation ATPase